MEIANMLPHMAIPDVASCHWLHPAGRPFEQLPAHGSDPRGQQVLHGIRAPKKVLSGPHGDGRGGLLLPDALGLDPAAPRCGGWRPICGLPTEKGRS